MNGRIPTWDSTSSIIRDVLPGIFFRLVGFDRLDTLVRVYRPIVTYSNRRPVYLRTLSFEGLAASCLLALAQCSAASSKGGSADFTQSFTIQLTKMSDKKDEAQRSALEAKQQIIVYSYKKNQ
jgi:hypothetical protein